MKYQGYVRPVFYDCVTIVFNDFVGFTKIKKTLLPDQLVAELDEAFSQFYRIMDKYGLENRAAYMLFAGGVPVANNTHEIDAVLGVPEIQSFIRWINDAKKLAGRPVFEIRIGINTGSLMTGIIGLKKSLYDVWGDAVNLASRMESTGEKNRINISETSYERIKEVFDVEYHGQVMAKNKGTVKCIFCKKSKTRTCPRVRGINTR